MKGPTSAGIATGAYTCWPAPDVTPTSTAKSTAAYRSGVTRSGAVASDENHKFLTNDVQNDPRVHNHQWARELGLVSFAGYQLRVPGGETLGVLALFAKAPIAADEDAMLDGMSSTIALVVQQAAAEESLKQLNRQLEVAAVQVKALMTDVIQKSILTNRFDNPSLTPCWEAKKCDNTACPSYQNHKNLRCWEVAGTFCGGKVQGRFAQKLGAAASAKSTDVPAPTRSWTWARRSTT